MIQVKYILLLGCFLVMINRLDAQNCSELRNQSHMIVSKDPDLAKINHVVLNGNSIHANTGFKFVQVRDSHTFVLLPDDFRGPVVDLKALLRPSKQTAMVIDGTVPMVQLQCDASGADCQHFRCGKQCVSCGGECADAKWTVRTLPDERLIVIPSFKNRFSK